jgi:soluble cytochrome b562
MILAMSSTLSRFRYRALLLVLLLAIAPLAQASEIKRLMKDMKLAMQGAMASTTMAQFSGYVSRLQSDALEVSSQQYRSDPATYREGMQALQQELTAVDQAVRANDLVAAKQGLQKINDTKKHYHDLLN